jgi:hypothetical protein
MTTPRRQIKDVIESSSLGTPSARAARQTVSVQRGRAVVERAAAHSLARRKQTTTHEKAQPDSGIIGSGAPRSR